MHPTLFTIGGLNIPTYTVLLDLGLILGLLLTYVEGRRHLGSGEKALDVGLWMVIGGIIGGRIGYVLANWSVFSEDWSQAWRIWEGGLSFHGAFLGGLAAMAILALLQKRQEEPLSFWDMGDVVTPGLALAIAFGWAACLMGGCAYGALGQGFGHAVLPDIYGVEASRFATQVLGIAWSLTLFLLFFLLSGRWPFPGAAFLMYILLYFAGQLFLEFTRGDEAIYLGRWRLAQVLDLVVVLIAAVALLVLWWQAQRREALPPAEDAVEETEEPDGTGAESEEGAEEAKEEEDGEAVDAEIAGTRDADRVGEPPEPHETEEVEGTEGTEDPQK